MITPLETLLLIVLVVVLIVIFKPEIVIRFARSIGEIRRASKSESDDQLMRIADTLGVSVEGKSRDEVMREVREALRRLAKERHG
ncbi:MAG: hypothetical protein NZ920_02005 [Aigarchaeota archaeon]|nr:hypothetical protein [Aigarchaeota archaeon]MDW8092601.1 hypothetical protein [Nitrososphaerota archaeon]